MAKNKRKISKAQRDKISIDIAKALKKSGILSKQTNLHSGRYISRDVLAKVKQYQFAADLGYKATPVSKEVAKAAKERGFQVVGGNKIIGPNTAQFSKRIKEGKLTGVRPVKGGLMEEVVLPHSVMDMYSLVAQLEEGIDTLKLPEEQFAFKFFGNESYRAFRDTADLLGYLKHYKSIFTPSGSLKAEDLQEEFQNLVLFRLHPHDVDRNIRGPAKRKADKLAAGKTGADGRRPKKSLAEKLQNMPQERAKRIRDKMAKQSSERRAALAANPAKQEEYRQKARERARASYEKRKGK